MTLKLPQGAAGGALKVAGTIIMSLMAGWPHSELEGFCPVWKECGMAHACQKCETKGAGNVT